MVKCSFCNFENEDGSLYCEQCKTDLSLAIPLAKTAPEEILAAVVEPMAADVPVAALAEGAAAAPAAAQAEPAAETPSGPSVPPGASPKFVVIRGQKIDAEFPIYPELNFIGRADDKPVDIDLEDQEPPDRVWSSRQHAVVHFDNAQGMITIEDLNSANGTFVNRNRVHPGQKQQLMAGDVIQIGTVHLKLKA